MPTSHRNNGLMWASAPTKPINYHLLKEKTCDIRVAQEIIQKNRTLYCLRIMYLRFLTWAERHGIDMSTQQALNMVFAFLVSFLIFIPALIVFVIRKKSLEEIINYIFIYFIYCIIKIIKMICPPKTNIHWSLR